MIKLTAIALIAASALWAQSSPDQWSTAVHSTNGSTISGTASVAGFGTADSTTVKISIKGALANASLAWHVHNGSCKAPGAVLGSESAYPRLQTSGTGSADGLATLPIRPVKAKPYIIQVHRGTAAGGVKTGSDVIACGDLMPMLNKPPGS